MFFDLKFIDEDGFIIHTLHSWWLNSDYKHEKYEGVDLRNFWHRDDIDNVFSMALFEGKINEDIIKNTTKIVYEPSVEIIRSKLRNDDNDEITPGPKQPQWGDFKTPTNYQEEKVGCIRRKNTGN